MRTSSIRTRVLPDSACVVGSSSCCRVPDSVPSIDVRPACARSACPSAHRPPRIAGSRRPPIDRPDPVGVSATDPFTLACRQASASSGTAASSVTSICPAAVVPTATGPRTPDASNRRSTSRFSIRPTRRLSRAAPAAVTASVPFTSIAPASDVTERESTSSRPAAYVASAAMLIDGAVPRRTIGPSNLMFTVGSAISPRTCHVGRGRSRQRDIALQHKAAGARQVGIEPGPRFDHGWFPRGRRSSHPEPGGPPAHQREARER